jgi:PAS domain S-box-containing protein
MLSDHNFGFELFDTFPDMYFLLNVKGDILKMNRKAKELLQYDKNNPPQNFIDIIELCDHEKANQKFIECLSNKNKAELETRFYIHHNYINVNLSYAFPVTLNGNEQNDYVFAIAKDISKEKQKEIDLLRFFNVVENNINPIQITDLNGKMIYVNPALVKASGYSKEDLIGKNPRIFGSGKMPRKFWDKMWNAISSGKPWFGEVEDRKKNGEPFYTQLLISPIVDAEGKVTGYFGVHRDMSEKRTLEHKLIQTQKMESIGTLAAGVAHEVGNPLASISALVQVAQRNTSDEFIIEKLGLVKNQITRISKIIRDLVDFSRPSNFELQTLNINEGLKEAVDITKVGTKAKNIDFNVKLSSDVPSLPLIADQVEQVFVNILLNAVDAINDPLNTKTEKQIDIESSVTDDEVIITFSDTGTGIREEDLNKIFEPFFTTKGKGKGTGLGLWVSYGIIKSFQGGLEVKSKLGEGTTFTIKLPIE